MLIYMTVQRCHYKMAVAALIGPISSMAYAGPVVLATLEGHNNLFIAALYCCCCYAKWRHSSRGGEAVEMEGEEITEEQYGVEQDVPCTDLPILFAITTLSFLSNVHNISLTISFFFLISTYIIHFVQLWNQKSKHYITRWNIVQRDTIKYDSLNRDKTYGTRLPSL